MPRPQLQTRPPLCATLLAALALGLGACGDAPSAGNTGTAAGSGAGPTDGTGASNNRDTSVAGTPRAE